ncbi:MAG: aldo/keto reductase [Phycisphaerae bacterium]|jgi:predicted aldo/keto reductase-like oxidoreductase
MLHRPLGRTGLAVSQLGFGAMRLPMVGEGDAARVNRELAIPMIHRAFAAGVNYIDTAVGYCKADSQRAVGDALKGWRGRGREKVIVSTKNPYYGTDEKEWWKNLTDSLERLQVDCIDIYNHHGVRWAKYEEFVAPVMSRWMLKAKDQGLIKHICCSFHDSPDALRKVVDTGYVESITLQYNLLDRSLEDGIAYAHQRGIGVVVMGPVGGGRLGADSETLAQLVPGIQRVPELALRFVLSNQNVSMALSGMSTMQQVEENLATAEDATPLSEEDKKAIDEHLARLAKLADLYCTGCGYCLPCPKEINIPHLFRIYNHAKIYGLWDHARKAYRSIQRGPIPKKRSAAADACSDCGACETKCPQNLPVRKQLQELHEALADKTLTPSPAPKDAPHAH